MTTGYSIDDDRLITMGVLTRPQHEKFAQLVASGSTIVDAYEKSGYPRNRSNACRLRLRERISARIDELQSQRTAAVELAQLSAAEKAGVSHLWVLRTLRRNSVLAARRGDMAASTRAAELVGKHLGMFIERKEIQINMIDDADQYLQQLLEIVKMPVLEHQAPQLEHAAEGGQKYGSEPGADQEAADIIEEVGQ
jgi:hypothetical protein